MRELKLDELDSIAGGLVCTPANSYGGITDGSTVGQDLINIYEGLVAATSHMIERVATSF
ncbi:MAG: hypothetical protein ACR2QR_00395 [Woeseiaceae bacterium]